MKINKKQLEFIQYLEKCGGIFINQVDYSKYPLSMIKSLKEKGLVVEFKNVLTSTTGG